MDTAGSLKTVSVIPTDILNPILILEEIFFTFRIVTPFGRLETCQVSVEGTSSVFRMTLIIANALRNLEMTKNGFIIGRVS